MVCPSCAADLEEWFHTKLTTAYKEIQATGLDITTPCCGVKTFLNDLDFRFQPAAFSRFVIEVMNPDVATTPAQDERISACVGCDLRKMWMRL